MEVVEALLAWGAVCYWWWYDADSKEIRGSCTVVIVGGDAG